MVTLAAVVTWLGRILALVVLAVSGAFFVEHLGWFLHPTVGWPPARVWLLQLVHLGLLVGLALLFRWEIAGGVLTIAAALALFSAVAGPRFWPFFGATVLPVALLVLGRLLRARSAPWSPVS
jgi:hypothetical protein